MARVRGLHGDVLDGLLAEFEALVMRILRRIAAATASLLAGHSHASVDDLAVIPAQWVEAVDGEVMPALFGVYQRAAAAVVDGLAAFGHDVGALLSPEGADFMAEARNRLVGIGDAVWEAARDELVAGMHAGEDISQLAARVAGAADVSEARATVIARTEVVAANNAGSYAQALMLNDPNMMKAWEATPDDRTRSTHRVADGQSVPLREPFEVGGAALLFPGDPTGPVEEVAGCRCAQAYDLADEPVTASAGSECGGAFCRNPLHPGPCKGWRHRGKATPDAVKDKPTSDHKEAGSAPLEGAAALEAAPARFTPDPKWNSGGLDGAKIEGVDHPGSARAIGEYQGLEYGETNSVLRGHYATMPDSIKRQQEDPEEAADVAAVRRQVHERVAEIDKTMNESPLAADITVRRVIKDPWPVLGDAWMSDVTDDDWDRGVRPDLTGLSWQEDAYVSTTTDGQVVDHYLHVSRYNEPVELRIRVSRGTHAIRLSDPPPAGEAELLLQRGLRMQITQDHGTDPTSGHRVLDVEAVAHG